MENITQIKEKYKLYKENRFLYISKIIGDIYNNNEYKKICEIGAGEMELATYLSANYQQVDAYEPMYDQNQKMSISNLSVYHNFNSFVNISKYDLIVSICPYCYSFEYDDFDPEQETKELLSNIVDMSIDNEKDLFLVLSNTPGSHEFLKEILHKEKYRKFMQERIELHFKKFDEKRVATNNLLILKK